MNRKLTAITLTLTLVEALAMLSGCSQSQSGEIKTDAGKAASDRTDTDKTDSSDTDDSLKASKVESIVTDVVVNTTVTPGGQFPDSLTVTLDKAPSGSVSAADFSMKGEAYNWMDPSLHEFTASFADALLDGNVLTLVFDGFDDKYFFVDNWTVTDSADSSLDFTSDAISRVIAPVADEFEDFTKENGESFDYHLFTPGDTGKAQPLVVVFHGYADTHNLLAYRTSVAWAEPDAQAVRPCYVLSPVIDDNAYIDAKGRDAVYEALYEKIQEMTADGRVDASRIYIMGNSFGGMATIEFMEKYPDLAAGGIALCSALNYSQTAVSNLDKITDIPLWIAQADNDSTISSDNSKNMYKKLCELGDTKAKLTIYSDEEMNAAGGSSDPNSTFSYHHVEMAVMEDPAYAEWLFEQHKD